LILRITGHGAAGEQPLQAGLGLHILSQVASAQISNHADDTTVTITFRCRPPNVLAD